jgi:alanyl-tRNA synthetase
VLNWALREVLGEHVQQKGSLVDDEKTRFDFSHQKGLTPDELGRIEELCGKQIAGDLKVYWKEVPQADALKINGLRAVFGEKYPDIVRVVSVGVPVDDLLGNPDNADWRKYSVEFCGGTHVASTREIGRFVLAAEESVAKGIRRVVGLTGERAADAVATGDKLLQRADQLRSSAPGDVDKGLGELQKDMNAAQIPIRMREQLREAIADLQKIVKQQQKEHAAAATGVIQERIAALIADAQKVGDSAIVVGEVPDVPADQIKHGADTIKQKCGSAAIFLGARSDGKAVLLAAMTDDLIQRGLKAGDLVKHIAPIVKGGGGGPPTMAQAGGKDPDALPDALTAAAEWIQQKLG